MNTDDAYYGLVLSRLTAISCDTLDELVRHHGSARRVVESWSSLRIEASNQQDLACDMDTARIFADREIQELGRHGARVVFYYDQEYPTLLRNIYDPPRALYIKGDHLGAHHPALAVVGSRRCTYYGQKVAKQLCAEMVEAGLSTVSGLARGIDTCVHQATIESGGLTYAVMGSGLGHVYPPENAILADRIAESGALISELPMKTRPLRSNFPKRNRIIAGLSIGTVVVEGTDKSGSLITARIACEEGRDVFAVPGPITSLQAAAPHRLIQMGAKLICNVSDILDEYSVSPVVTNRRKTAPQDFPEPWERILSMLSDMPLHKDVLARQLDGAVGNFSSEILRMEVNGLVKSLPGGFVVRA